MSSPRLECTLQENVTPQGEKMIQMCSRHTTPIVLMSVGLGLLLALVGRVSAQPLADDCQRAWRDYNEFKRRTTMEASQYPLTTQGLAVRTACGEEALPVPPGADNPRRVVVRPKHKPAVPVDSVKPAPPAKTGVKPN